MKKEAQPSAAPFAFSWERSLAITGNYWLLAVGYSLLAIGYWLLAIGYWLLATGHHFHH